MGGHGEGEKRGKDKEKRIKEQGTRIKETGSGNEGEGRTGG